MTDNVTAVATKIDWSSLSDVILDGGYELKGILDSRDNAAKIRVRILGSGGKSGTAYFLQLDPKDADDQLDVWTILREAPHPNLSLPAAIGRREVSGASTVYMVLPDADERLAAVVPERPLEWEEAAEVLHSCEKGLAHLHARGLLHGSVSPQTVEAVGYSVLLNTESVHRIGKTPRIQWSKPLYLAPESKGLNLTTAADVWCMGATLFEVLQQERYGTPGVELEKGLPLAAVVQRCLDKNPITRCTLKEAPNVEQSAALAQSAAPPPAPAAVPPITNTAAASAATPPPAPSTQTSPAADPRAPYYTSTSTARTARGSRLPQPLTPKEPPKQVTKDDMALVPIGKRHKKVQRQPVGARIRTLDLDQAAAAGGETSEAVALGPVVSARITALGQKSNMVRNVVAAVGLIAMFVAAVWFIVLPKLRSIEQPMAPTTVTQTDAPPIAPTPAFPSANSSAPAPLDVATPAEMTRTDSAATTAEPVAPKQRQFFRVVIGSYGTRSEAAHELETISQQHPELILHVGRMKTADSGAELRYALAVGGVLERGDAEPLRERLMKKGLKTARLEEVFK